MNILKNKKYCKLLLLLVAIALFGGCNNSRPATAMVSGIVQYKGKKITSGMVHFYEPSEGVSVMCPIDENGRYQSPEKMLTGEYKVEIQPQETAPPAPGSNDMPAPPVMEALPRKYSSMATSGISKTLIEGENEHDISLP